MGNPAPMWTQWNSTWINRSGFIGTPSYREISALTRERGISILRASQSKKERLLLPVGARSVFPFRLSHVESWAGAKRKKRKKERRKGERRRDRRNWRKEKGEGWQEGERKEPGDSSTVFACGKLVGTVRCKVNGLERRELGLVRLLARYARWRWTMAPYTSRFPVRSAWKRGTGTTGQCTATPDQPYVKTEQWIRSREIWEKNSWCY